MSYEPGDRVTYEGELAIVATVFDDDTVNLVRGSAWSTASEGPWPVTPEANVDVDDLIDGWPEEDEDAEADDEDESTGAVTTEDFEPEDDGEDDFDDDMPEGGDVDVDAFLDRNVPEIEDDVASGHYDHKLDAIEEAEIAGEDRVGVATAIANRRDEIEGE